MIRIILKSFTIRTARVAALEAFDWAANWAKLLPLEVEKIMSEIKLISKIMDAVDKISRKKKKEKK